MPPSLSLSGARSRARALSLHQDMITQHVREIAKEVVIQARARAPNRESARQHQGHDASTTSIKTMGGRDGPGTVVTGPPRGGVEGGGVREPLLSGEGWSSTASSSTGTLTTQSASISAQALQGLQRIPAGPVSGGGAANLAPSTGSACTIAENHAP